MFRYRFGGVGLLAVLALSPAHAQRSRGTAMIFGAVVNRASQGLVRDAEIIHVADGRVAKSDSLGFYRFEELGAGIVRFVVRASGYPPTTLVVALQNGERLERDIELDSTTTAAQATGRSTPQALPEVTVEAAPSLGRRFADFERRKLTGRGHYLTRTQIDESGASTLQDAVRNLRGVMVDCGGGGGCFIRMARAPMRCQPEYIVDERVDNEFGPYVAVRDIEALEVYTGPSDVPGEFSGRNAGCGVIVIWTRSGPPRRR